MSFKGQVVVKVLVELDDGSRYVVRESDAEAASIVLEQGGAFDYLSWETAGHKSGEE